MQGEQLQQNRGCYFLMQALFPFHQFNEDIFIFVFIFKINEQVYQ